MADNKRYYYLKLKENFFDRAEIKTIEGMQSGYEYICIIQKMYLRSLSREGKLMLTDTIPYDLQTLSSVLGHKQNAIKMAIEIFSKLNLCEILDDKSIYMTEIQNFIGESSTEADRIREYRLKINENKQKLLSSDVQMYDKCTPELELELELEKKKEKISFSRENEQEFIPTSKQQIPQETIRDPNYCLILPKIHDKRGVFPQFCREFRKASFCDKDWNACTPIFKNVEKKMKGLNIPENSKGYWGAFMNQIKDIIHSDKTHDWVKDKRTDIPENKFFNFKKDEVKEYETA